MGRGLVGSIFLETLTRDYFATEKIELVFLFSTLEQKIPRKQQNFT